MKLYFFSLAYLQSYISLTMTMLSVIWCHMVFLLSAFCLTHTLPIITIYEKAVFILKNKIYPNFTC